MTAPRSTFSRADAVLLLILALVWGSGALFIRVVVQEVDPVWLVGGRLVAGLAVTAVFLLVRGRKLPRTARAWRHLTVLALVAMAGPWLLLATAGQHIPAGLATLLGAPTPAMTMAIAAGLGLERITAGRIAGMGLALVGVVLVVSGSATTSGRLGSVGLVLLSAVLFAIGTVYAKRNLTGMDPSVAVAGQLVVATLVVLPAAFVLEPTPEVTGLSVPAMAAWLVLGCVSTGGAFVVYYGLIERVGATNTLLASYLAPGIGLLAGWLVLGEAIGTSVFLGLGAILPGLWLAQRQPVEDVRRLDRRMWRWERFRFRRLERSAP